MRVLCPCGCCCVGVLYVCGRRLAGAQGPCGCHWAAVPGLHGHHRVAALCIGVVSMGGRRREECTHVIVILQGLWVGIVVVTQWPCGCVVVVVQHCDCMEAAQQF